MYESCGLGKVRRVIALIVVCVLSFSMFDVQIIASPVTDSEQKVYADSVQAVSGEGKVGQGVVTPTVASVYNEVKTDLGKEPVELSKPKAVSMDVYDDVPALTTTVLPKSTVTSMPTPTIQKINSIDSSQLISATMTPTLTPTLTPTVILSPTAVMKTTTINQDVILTEDKEYEDLVISAGTMKLNGHKVVVKGNLNNTGGTIEPGGGRLEVWSNYSQSGNNGAVYIKMNKKEDYMLVKGNYSVTGFFPQNGSLTDGVIEIKGDFTEGCVGYEDNFVASGNNKVILSGDKKQTIKFQKPVGSYFNVLEIKNTSKDGVVSDGCVNVRKIITNGNKVDNIKIGLASGTFTEDFIYEGKLSLVGGTVDLNGYKITSKGDFNISGGTLNMNGGTIKVEGNLNNTGGTLEIGCGRLEVWGNYSQSGEYNAGYIKMNKKEDYMLVKGNYTVNGFFPQNGSITDGVIEIKGDFSEEYVSYENNFVASGNNKVILSGDKKQTIQFQKPVGSYFNVLEIKNTSTEGVVSDGCVNVRKIITNGNKVDNIKIGLASGTFTEDFIYEGKLSLVGGTVNLNGYKITSKGDFNISGGTLNMNGGTIKVEGNLNNTGGTLEIGGGRLEVWGNYSQSGEYNEAYIRMNKKEDYMLVKGNYTVNGFFPQNGNITDGIIEIKGDFTEGYVSYENNFVASGNNKVILSGDKKQTIKFQRPAGSYFNVLEFKNTSKEGVVSDGYVGVNRLITNGNDINNIKIEVIGTLCEDFICDADTIMCNILNLNGHKLEIKGSLTQQDGTINLQGGQLIAGSYIQNGGGLNLNKGDMEVKGDLIQKGNIDINGGEFKVGRNYTQTTGTLSLNGGKLKIKGNYEQAGYYLYMENEKDYMQVLGNFVVNSGWQDVLKAGILEIKGDFMVKESRAFTANGNHKVILSGDKQQTIYFQYPEYNYFNVLEIRNTSTDGVKSDGYINDRKIITNGNKTDIKVGLGDSVLTEDKVYNQDMVMLGGTLNLNGHKVEIKGKLTQQAGDINLQGGQLIVGSYIQSGGSLNLNKGDMEVKGDLTQKGNIDINGGEFKVGGNFTQTAGTLSLGGGRLVIEGNYEQTGYYLYMENEKDYMQVLGNFVVNSGWQDVLKAGILEIKGDFKVKESRAFTANGNHKVKLSGDKLQTIYFQYPEYNYFNVLEIRNTSADGVKSDGYINDRKIITNGNKTDIKICLGDTVLTEDKVYDQDMVMLGGTLNLNGHKVEIKGKFTQQAGDINLQGGQLIVGSYIQNGGGLNLNKGDMEVKWDLTQKGNIDINGGEFNVGGNYTQTTGTLSLGGGRLVIEGNYEQTGYYLYMENDKDYMMVLGNFVLNSGWQDVLKAGILEIKGDFKVKESHAFTANGNHKVVLSGDKQQTIYFQYPEYNYFNVLEIRNTSADGVKSDGYINDSKIITNGNKTDIKICLGDNVLTEDKVYNQDMVMLGGTLNLNGHKVEIKGKLTQQVGDINLQGGQLIAGSYIQSSGGLNLNKGDMEVKGDLTQKGNIDINGGEFNVGGNYTQTTGSLSLGGGWLLIEGNYEQAGYYLYMENEKDYMQVLGNYVVNGSWINSLTAGVLEVKGDFTTKEDRSFIASGNHKVILSGNKLQKIGFKDSGNNNFNILEITKPLDTGYSYGGKPVWKTLIRRDPDTEPPTIPQELAGREDLRVVALTWKPSTDGIMMGWYEVYRDGVLVGKTFENSYVDKNLELSTRYSYRIRAFDMEGNESAFGNEISITTRADDELPMKPDNLRIIELNGNSVKLLWNSSTDNDGIKYYEVYRDGSHIASVAESVYMDNSLVLGKSYTYTIKAVDKAGNVSIASEALKVTAELTPIATPTPTAKETPIATPTPTAKETPVATPTPTAKETPVATPTPTAKETPVATPAPTAEKSPVATLTPTAKETPVATPTVEETPVVTPTPTAKETPVATPTPTAKETQVGTPTPTTNETPTATPAQTTSKKKGHGGGGGSVSIVKGPTEIIPAEIIPKDSPVTPTLEPTLVPSVIPVGTSEQRISINTEYETIRNAVTDKEILNAVEALISKINISEKEDFTYINNILKLLEFGIQKIATVEIKPVDGKVNINEAEIDKIYNKAKEAKEKIEKMLVEKGIELGRNLSFIPIFRMEGQDKIAINFDRNAFDENKYIDGINVLCGDVGIIMDSKTAKSQFGNDSKLTVKMEKVTVDDKSKHKAVKISFADSNGVEKRQLEENIKIELPAINGDSEYQSIVKYDPAKPVYIGGKYDKAIQCMVAKTRTSGEYYVVEETKDFTDISSCDNDMKNAIEVLASKGIISGNAQGTYNPNSQIKRSEFATLIVKGLDKLDFYAKADFNDVSERAWYYQYVASANQAGIISGYEDKTFRGELVIKTQEIVTVCAKALNTELGFVYPSDEDKYLNYLDKERIPKWVRKYVALGSREGIIVKREDGNFQGDVPCTRGYAALVLYRLYSML